MKEYQKQRFVGERAHFSCRDAHFSEVIFADGESPLKEGSNLRLDGCAFQWKYPLWYCKNVSVSDTAFMAGARAGIWYTDHIALTNCLYEAQKGLRRVQDLLLSSVDFPHALETLWNCTDVRMENVSVCGDYFGKDCEDVQAQNLRVSGSYLFDGCRNVHVFGGMILSKDAFWNCRNVTVEDALISGEYLGWNSTDVTFKNCTIESLQGMCYMKNVRLINCRLLHTTLAFEYSTVDAEVKSKIDSVKNPSGGVIRAKEIGELILDPACVDPQKTEIIYEV